MPRVGHVTETGTQRSFASRVRHWLRVLRDDLWTRRADPLPRSERLRWLPHAVLCLAALGITIGDTGQLQDNGRLAFGLAFPIAIAQGALIEGEISVTSGLEPQLFEEKRRY